MWWCLKNHKWCWLRWGPPPTHRHHKKSRRERKNGGERDKARKIGRQRGETFLYVLYSFGVDLSTLTRIKTHAPSSMSQEHSIIFPEIIELSPASARRQLILNIIRRQKQKKNWKPLSSLQASSAPVKHHKEQSFNNLILSVTEDQNAVENFEGNKARSLATFNKFWSKVLLWSTLQPHLW